MNPDDFTLISITGSSFFLNGVGLLATAIPYGIYLLLFTFTVVILCRNEAKRRAKIVLLSAVVAMFAIATLFVTAYAIVFLQGIRMVLINNPGEPVANKIIAYRDRYLKLSLVQPVLFFLEVILGDFVVVWRAWALWLENRKLVVLPVLFLLGATASTFSYLACAIHYSWPINLPPVCNSLNISTYVLSMATNITATSAIGYKVWAHRRMVKKYLVSNGTGTRGLKVLVLILESGLVYSLLWLPQLATFIPSVGETYSGQLAQQLLNCLSVQLVGIYPTAVVVLVYLERSLWDLTGSNTLLRPSQATNNTRLSFATVERLNEDSLSDPRGRITRPASISGLPPSSYVAMDK